MKQTKQK
jgi:hypothetical protein